jgi:flavin reductase
MADGSDAGAFLLAQAAAAEVDETAFRQAMSRLAGGVAVVACQAREGPVGLLISSLVTLSVEPARVLFCVRKEAAAHNALARARELSLSVLADHHLTEAQRFSSGALAPERFESPYWLLDESAPPALPDALVSLRGVREQLIDGGSHSLFIVRVHQADSVAHSPLLYFERDFRGIGGRAGGVAQS